MEKKAREEESKRDIKEIDPYACKLSDIPHSITEDDIEMAMNQKFGKVKRCRIPIDRERNKPLGFAIVVFEKKEEASRAIAEGEVNVEMACLTIEVAMQGKKPDRERNAGFAAEQFAMIKRRQ